MWLFPYLTWAALAMIGVVVVTMGVIEDSRSQLWLSVVSLTGILAVYVVFVRPRAARRS